MLRPHKRTGRGHMYSAIMEGTTTIGVGHIFRNIMKPEREREWWYWSCPIAMAVAVDMISYHTLDLNRLLLIDLFILKSTLLI